jgi:hypothetical protein
MFKNKTTAVASKANGLCKGRRSRKKRGVPDASKNVKTPHSSSSDSRYSSRRSSESAAALDDNDELKFEPK